MTGHEVSQRTVSDVLKSGSDDASREVEAGRSVNRVVGLLNEALAVSGRTQVEIAEALGVTAGRVSQVFSGEGNIRISTLARYLRAMGYSLELNARPVVGNLARIGGSRRKRSRPGSAAAKEFDAWAGLVSQNDTEYLQFLLVDSDAPDDAVTIGEPQYIGRLKTETQAAFTVLFKDAQTRELPVLEVAKASGK